jgi:hypothetical protein
VYFLNAFYSVLWDSSDEFSRNRLNLEVLAGEHKEAAFIEIKTEMECLKKNRAPLIKS